MLGNGREFEDVVVDAVDDTVHVLDAHGGVLETIPDRHLR